MAKSVLFQAIPTVVTDTYNAAFVYFITNGLPSGISKNIFFGKKETFFFVFCHKSVKRMLNSL